MEMERQPVQQAGGLQLRRLVVGDDSPFLSLTLAESGIRSRWHCMVVGFEDDGGNIVPATAERVICRTDVLWLVGEDDDVRRLLRA